MNRLVAIARLGWWLGPGAARPPAGIVRRERSGEVESLVYAPPSGVTTRGVYVVVSGLHPNGAADPRLERFARALAGVGFETVTPFVRDHIELRVLPSATDDVAAAFGVAERIAMERALPRPALFGISFGCAPALDLASRPEHRDRVGGVIAFGGYGDLRATARAVVTPPSDGEQRPWDALNAPCVFINVAAHFGESGLLAAAGWRTFIQRTWGRAHLKPRGAAVPIAEEIAVTLPPAARELFLIGCHALPGGAAALDRALDAGAMVDVDPRRYCAAITAPVAIVHSADDDIVPSAEAATLAAALPPAHPHRVIRIASFSHGGAFRVGAALAQPSRLVTLLRAIDAAPRGKLATLCG